MHGRNYLTYLLRPVAGPFGEEMSSLICGSVAYDTIMTFDGRFREHILPDQIHMLNVSFLVPGMRREFGGCAGNIAYTLKMLGGDPVVMATVGQDAGPYLQYLRDLGIATDHIRTLPDTFTAQAMITTDLDNNQITAFHPGAMGQSQANSVQDALGAGKRPALGIVAPDSREGMLHHAQQFAEAGIPFIFDPGQQCARMSGEELRDGLTGAHILICNDYEFELIRQKTGLSEAEVLREAAILVVTRGEIGRAHV